MNLSQVISDILNPGLARLPMAMDTPAARVMLLSIGQQESRFEARAQLLSDGSKGPARGLWQFERGGGVKGVMNNETTTGHAHRLCEDRGVPWDAQAIWERLETDDILACCFARLLLYADPKPLPLVSDTEGSWDLYAKRAWRPGKPKPDTWADYHSKARAALGV